MRRSDAEGRPADAEGAEQAPAAAPAADPAHPGNGAAGLGLLERAFERLAQAEAEQRTSEPFVSRLHCGRKA